MSHANDNLRAADYLDEYPPLSDEFMREWTRILAAERAARLVTNEHGTAVWP